MPSVRALRPSTAFPLRSAPDRTTADLVDLVRSVSRQPAMWARHLYLDRPGAPDRTGRPARHWARLPAPPHVDLWLLTWFPGQATDLHDHGDAAASFTVVLGEVDEVREGWHPSGRTPTTNTPATLATHRLRTGDTRWMAAGVRHDVRHAGTGPAASLHAYSPRLTRMTFWAPTGTGLRAVRTLTTDEPEPEEAG